MSDINEHRQEPLRHSVIEWAGFQWDSTHARYHMAADTHVLLLEEESVTGLHYVSVVYLTHTICKWPFPIRTFGQLLDLLSSIGKRV